MSADYSEARTNAMAVDVGEYWLVSDQFGAAVSWQNCPCIGEPVGQVSLFTSPCQSNATAGIERLVQSCCQSHTTAGTAQERDLHLSMCDATQDHLSSHTA
jgi:hypothetical protein